MPEHPNPKPRPHPWSRRGERTGPPASRARVDYAELAVTSNFTFLRGASHPEELVERAAALGYRAIGIADRSSLAGVVRAHVAAEEAGIPLAVGCRLELALEESALGTLSVLAFASDRASYGRLCRLLTLGKRRAPKGECRLGLEDLFDDHEGLLALVLPPDRLERAVARCELAELLARLRGVFDQDRLSLGATCLLGGDDRGRLATLAALGASARVPLAALNDVHFHVPERRPLQDVLTCIRRGTSLAAAGRELFANAERFLKTPAELAALFAEHPGALARSAEVAERAAAFSLRELRYQYPDEICPDGRAPLEHLVALTQAGARERYPRGLPAKVNWQIQHELQLIEELAYAPYFLTVYDMTVFARSRGILCQGRGAAANSAVCYCLGITSVDPDRIDLLFERFVSKERNEPPDIDIDFEHERREEVIQYLYAKYGRDRAALTAEVVTYRGRSAVREVGKALGLSLDCVDRLAKEIDWWHDDLDDAERVRELGLDPRDPTMENLIALVGELMGFPRHLSQHVGGFVITRDPLCELVPIENAAMPDRTVIEWDKDDIDALGMLKVDVLGLGMLTCVRKAFELLEDEPGAGEAGERHRRATYRRPSSFALHTIPADDPEVYDMICRADTVGVFQIESRAQMAMLPRLRPRTFYDLVIEVAIVRPGPIQGDMVHPYLRRRRGDEPVSFPSPDVEKVLKKTLGVPLFQEQAMALAVVAAGFTPGEADELRRAMAAWKRSGKQIERFGRKLVGGMIERGYGREFAEGCFRQIQGFSEYGFPESHAASFALVVWVSAWLKHHHPAAFAAALLNSQPMGFYAPAQIVRDAREHDVEVRPVDVNASAWDCTLERGAPGRGPAIRLGLRLVKGLGEREGRALAEAVARHGRCASIARLWRASGVRAATLRRLAQADAFGSLGLAREDALWQVRALRDEELPLYDALPPDLDGTAPDLPRPTAAQRVFFDYGAIHLSLRAHPLSFARAQLGRRGAVPAGELKDAARYSHGTPVAVAGVVLVRQRPATASGVIFMTIEDETGIANLVVWPSTFERFRREARHSVALFARGRIERDGEVVHVVVLAFESLDRLIGALQARSRDFH